MNDGYPGGDIERNYTWGGAPRRCVPEKYYVTLPKPPKPRYCKSTSGCGGLEQWQGIMPPAHRDSCTRAPSGVLRRLLTTTATSFIAVMTSAVIIIIAALHVPLCCSAAELVLYSCCCGSMKQFAHAFAFGFGKLGPRSISVILELVILAGFSLSPY